MFVCPDCGFRDSPIWRACNWEFYAVYCKIDEFTVFFPEIAKTLQESEHHEFEDKNYYFKMTKTGFVKRIAKEYKDYIKKGHMREKPKDPFQTKLASLCENGINSPVPKQSENE